MLADHNNNENLAIRLQDRDFIVEVEAVALPAENGYRHFESQLSAIEDFIAAKESDIANLNSEIDRLTNHADSLDYTIAAGSGILAGLIDSFYVGEFDLGSSMGKSHELVNKFIEKFAKINGSGEKQNLSKYIEWLEDRFPVANDNAHRDLGLSNRLHHIEDIAHHPTPMGFAAALCVEFFRVCVFVDKDGSWHCKSLPIDKTKLFNTFAPLIFSALLGWLVRLAERKYTEKEQKEMPKWLHRLLVSLAAAPAVIKVLAVLYNQMGHLVSDMGGSKNTPGGGMGIPGIFISLLKEASSLPPLNATPLPRIVSDWYSKQHWDSRKELSAMLQIGKQAVPVIINEIIVRGFYFVRRLIGEYKRCGNWADVDWGKVTPWGNRTITRMLTVSTATFTAFDLIDAAVRTAATGAPDPLSFIAKMGLRINIVGVGRFVIAVYNDVSMGIERQKKLSERLGAYSQLISLKEARLYYLQAGMWKSAGIAEASIDDMQATARRAIACHMEGLAEIGQSVSELQTADINIDKSLKDEFYSILDL